MFRTDASPDPRFTDTLELDLSTVEPNLAGPRRPQDRVPLHGARAAFEIALEEWRGARIVTGPAVARMESEGGGGTAVAAELAVEEGSPPRGRADKLARRVGRASRRSPRARTPRTPPCLIGAGLLARNALARGLQRKPWVKTSLAPGSKVVTDYLAKAGLTPYLDALGFNLVGYGCTTCIGNSGPLPDDVADKVAERRSDRRRGALGQPQFRRPHPPAGSRELPRLAAARRRLRAGGLHGHRSHDRAARQGPQPARRLSQGHLADQCRDRRDDCGNVDRRALPRRATPTCSPATTAGAT